MLIKGQDPDNIVRGNTLHRGRPRRASSFDYMLSNPPFGVEWKKVAEGRSSEEHETQGFDGRFGPGLPRINDGSLLFLLHMISKMQPAEGGRQPPRHRLQRLAAVHRRRRLRRERDPPLDHRERLAGGHRRRCPTSSSTTPASAPTSGSHQPQAARRGRARSSSSTRSTSSRRCAKSLGNKRNELSQADIDEIVRLYGDVRGERAVQDLRQRRLRLPAHHGRASAPAELPGVAGAHRTA